MQQSQAGGGQRAALCRVKHPALLRKSRAESGSSSGVQAGRRAGQAQSSMCWLPAKALAWPPVLCVPMHTQFAQRKGTARGRRALKALLNCKFVQASKGEGRGNIGWVGGWVGRWQGERGPGCGH